MHWHLNPGTMVRAQYRLASDGTRRAFVDSLPGEDQLITASLNEFNHLQRFATAEYEARAKLLRRHGRARGNG